MFDLKPFVSRKVFVQFASFKNHFSCTLRALSFDTKFRHVPSKEDFDLKILQKGSYVGQR